MRAEYKYKLEDKVYIKAIETTGHVDGLATFKGGVEYRVVYWINSERKHTWVYEWEISLKP